MANFQAHYDVLPNGSKLYYSDTIPSAFPSTTGATPVFYPGDICWNMGSASGQSSEWLCTTGGTGSASVWEATALGAEYQIVGPLAAASTSSAFPLPPGTWVVANVTAVASTAGGTGATVTIEKLTGTTAPGSGTAQLSAALAIGTGYTANTVLTGALIAAPNSFNGGVDRMGIVLAGTLTGLVNLYVTVTMKRVN